MNADQGRQIPRRKGASRGTETRENLSRMGRPASGMKFNSCEDSRIAHGLLFICVPLGFDSPHHQRQEVTALNNRVRTPAGLSPPEMGSVLRTTEASEHERAFKLRKHMKTVFTEYQMSSIPLHFSSMQYFKLEFLQASNNLTEHQLVRQPSCSRRALQPHLRSWSSILLAGPSTMSSFTHLRNSPAPDLLRSHEFGFGIGSRRET